MGAAERRFQGEKSQKPLLNRSSSLGPLSTGPASLRSQQSEVPKAQPGEVTEWALSRERK